MKTEEAIEALKLQGGLEISGNMVRFKEFMEGLCVAEEALEKQIPKEPILKSGKTLVHLNKGDKPHEWKTEKWQGWFCPVCGKDVGERFNVHMPDGSVHSHDQNKSNYCSKCGQAIRWNEHLGGTERVIDDGKGKI